MSFIVNDHQKQEQQASPRLGGLSWMISSISLQMKQPVYLGASGIILVYSWLPVDSLIFVNDDGAAAKKPKLAYTSRQHSLLLLLHVWMANDVEITSRLMLGHESRPSVIARIAWVINCAFVTRCLSPKMLLGSRLCRLSSLLAINWPPPSRSRGVVGFFLVIILFGYQLRDYSIGLSDIRYYPIIFFLLM